MLVPSIGREFNRSCIFLEMILLRSFCCHCSFFRNVYDWMFSGKIEEEEKLRPEELNQQNIEALLAESNLVSPYLVHGS